MVQACSCSPQSLCPDVNQAWNNFEKNVLLPSVKKVVFIGSSLFYNLSLRSSLHRVVPFAIDTVKMFAPSYISPAIEGLKKTISDSETVTDGFTPLVLLSYFIGVRDRKVPKFVEINGKAYVVDIDESRQPKAGESSFKYHLRTRPYFAYANATLFGTGLFLTANLLNATQLLTYTTIASKFASVPFLGNAVQAVFNNTVMGNVINGGIGLYYLFCALDRGQYLKESAVDQMKSPLKGYLLLVGNIANVAVQVMVLAGALSTPWAFAGTAVMLGAQIYKEARSYDKGVKFDQLKNSLEKEFPAAKV